MVGLGSKPPIAAESTKVRSGPFASVGSKAAKPEKLRLSSSTHAETKVSFRPVRQGFGDQPLKGVVSPLALTFGPTSWLPDYFGLRSLRLPVPNQAARESVTEPHPSESGQDEGNGRSATTGLRVCADPFLSVIRNINSLKQGVMDKYGPSRQSHFPLILL